MFYYSKTSLVELLGESSSHFVLDVFLVWVLDLTFVIFNTFGYPFGLHFGHHIAIILTCIFRPQKYQNIQMVVELGGGHLRHHPDKGGTGSQLGGIWRHLDASGRHLETCGRHLEGIWKASTVGFPPLV